MKNESLTDVERMFTHAVMFKEGIVPMEDPHMDIRRALAGVTPEEARQLKRKFRKLWRSLRKGNPMLKTKKGTGHVVKSKLGTDPEAVIDIQMKPSKSDKLLRKMAVHKHLRSTKILPLVKQFNSLKNVLTQEIKHSEKHS